jgi:ADP-ribosylglycohydrolase
VGDAIGLHCEGLSKQRQKKIYPEISSHHFFFGHGMVSDDTEHTCMVAESLIVSQGNADRFLKDLAWRLRFWLLGLPAGIGYATLRAILKLWMGFSGKKSGVFSAGNGPAMRSAILGVCYGDRPELLCQFISANTQITHTDPKAEMGALAVAIAASMSASCEQINPAEYHKKLSSAWEKTPFQENAPEFLNLVSQSIASAQRGEATEMFAESLGLGYGVSGYVAHTVPVVIQCWLRHLEDYRKAILEIVRCGGDTDTTAAILGGIVGARVGKEGIPQEWLANLMEWPRTISWMEELGRKLARCLEQGRGEKALSLPIGKVLLRNCFFTALVLAHALRRLLPP